MKFRFGLILSAGCLASMIGSSTVQAGVEDKTFTGVVTLLTPDLSPVPYDWVITFNEDDTIDLVAAEIPQVGTYREIIDFGVISFYRAEVENEFETEFTGVCLLGVLNILTSFTDNDGNTLESGVLRVVPAKSASRSGKR